MKVELYASLAANGLMLTADPSHPTPQEILADFVRHAHEAGSLILGRATYEMALSQGAGAAFAGIEIVVVSSSAGPTPGAHRASSPSAALAYLRERGQARVLLGGGAVTYSAFLAESLVDELCLNIVPTVTSRGKPILASSEPRALRLVTTKQLVEGVTQLRFHVER